MRIKLSDITIDTQNIKVLHDKSKKLHSGLSKTIKPHYSIEFVNGTFLPITKHEYKIISSKIRKDKDERNF